LKLIEKCREGVVIDKAKVAFNEMKLARKKYGPEKNINFKTLSHLGIYLQKLITTYL